MWRSCEFTTWRRICNQFGLPESLQSATLLRCDAVAVITDFAAYFYCCDYFRTLSSSAPGAALQAKHQFTQTMTSI